MLVHLWKACLTSRSVFAFARMLVNHPCQGL